MKTTMLDSLSATIHERIESDKVIPDDLLQKYLQVIFELVQHPNSSILPRSFCLLRQALFKKWEYGDVEKLSPEMAFSVGALWSSAIFSELAEYELDKKPRIEAVAKQNLKYLMCFRAIHNQPGIRHKDLAKLSSLTTSELSQWMSKIQPENFFSFSRVGREKYYYIEELGENILQEMEIQQTVTPVALDLYTVRNQPFENLSTNANHLNLTTYSVTSNDILSIMAMFVCNSNKSQAIVFDTKIINQPAEEEGYEWKYNGTTQTQELLKCQNF